MTPVVFAGVLVAILAGAGDTRSQPNAPIAPSAVVAVVVWCLFGPALVYALGVLVEAWRLGDPHQGAIALSWALACVLVLFPWPIARRVFIPLGQIRLSWMVARLSLWVWRRDVPGGAAVAAAWAAVRRRRSGRTLSPSQLEWVELRATVETHRDVRWKLGGAGLVAAALLAEARGDRLGARRLMVSAGEVAEPTRPAHAVTVAWSWLCAEAMERAAWREVEFLARSCPIETRTTTFLGSVAARLTGIAPIPNDLQLQWQWFAAPQRGRTLELLQRALAAPRELRRTPPAQRREPGSTSDPSDGLEQELADSTAAEPILTRGCEALGEALALHARALVHPQAEGAREAIIALAQAWDRALDADTLVPHIQSRAEALGSHSSERNASALREAVRDDLLALIHEAGLELGPLGETSELLGRAARRLHGELLDGLELAVGALDNRVDAERELPALAEWQDFLAVREQYAAAVSLGGLPLRRVAFSIVHGPVCAQAVWLWNDRSERAIANAMFQWLLAEAIVVDNSKATTLQEKNVACGV